jgi:LPXTG-motif cell wall-anchored protein
VPFGGIRIDKQDANNAATKIAGATFEVFVIVAGEPEDCTAEAANDADTIYITRLTGTDPGDGSYGSTVDADTAVGDRIQWTTDATGRAIINGLRYSIRNGTNSTLIVNFFQPGDPDYLQYCLVEIATDPDYNLLAAPIAFEVNSPPDSGGSPQTVTVRNTLKNTPGFNLPRTGGTGLAIVIIIGVGLGATVLVLIGLRRVRERRAEGVASL